MPVPSPAAELGERLVDAMAALYGPHPGFRTAHARGICAEGVFTATAQAADLSRAPHLQGVAVPALVRFSNGTGDPTVPDNSPDGRGLAVKLRLPGGGSTDMVGLSLPAFFVRTP
ncbi:MAG: catalase, partial [Acidimicrobiales bacterium]